jgi:hypothetical protein
MMDTSIPQRDYEYRSQHQNQGRSSMKDDGDFTRNERKSKNTRPGSGNRESDNEGDAMAAPISKR